MRKILHIIDSINERVGAISSWLVLVLITVILYEVIARYVFGSPTAWGLGTFRMINGALIVLGWAYAHRHNSHIRVDIFYTRFSLRKKALVDVIGAGLIFLPLFGAFTILAGSYVQRAYLYYVARPAGLPANLLYQIMILIGLCFFFLQFAARFIRDLYILVKGRPQ